MREQLYNGPLSSLSRPFPSHLMNGVQHRHVLCLINMYKVMQREKSFSVEVNSKTTDC